MMQVTDASAGGAFLTASGRAHFSGARLRAGADAATATIRETDGSGRILCVLGAGIGACSDSMAEVAYTGNVFVEKTGTSPVILLYQR